MPTPHGVFGEGVALLAPTRRALSREYPAVERVAIDYQFSDRFGRGEVTYCFEVGRLVPLVGGYVVLVERLQPGMVFHLDNGAIATVTAAEPPVIWEPPPSLPDENGNYQRRVIGRIKSTGFMVLDLIFGEQTVTTTPGHLFYSRDRGGWARADALRVGERLRNGYGEGLRLDGKSRIRQGHIELYNIEVEEFHTYLVGHTLGVAALAHNGPPVPGMPACIPQPAAVQGMRKAFEHRHVARDFNEARQVARGLSGVGDDSVPFLSELGPHRGRTIGRMSPDGTRGWRIDFDPNDPSKGFHVNWWDRSGGNKRADWIYGYSHVTGGTEAQFLDLLRHAFGNVH